MTMAQQMGATADSAISLGVAQRVVLQNPGGSSTQNLGRRQDTSSSAAAAVSSSTSATDAAASGASSAATDSTAAAATSSTTAPDAAASSASAQPSPPPAQDPAQQQPATPPTQTQAQLPAATQLLLSPTFSPVSAQALLDSQNNRIAVPVSQVDGEFILTMGMAGAGTVQVSPATSGTPAAGQGQPATATPGEAPQQQEGNRTGEAPPASGILARQAAPVPLGTITMTMAQLQEMATRQATGGVIPVWNMMTQFVAQATAQPPIGSIKKRNPVQGFRAVQFKV